MSDLTDALEDWTDKRINRDLTQVLNYPTQFENLKLIVAAACGRSPRSVVVQDAPMHRLRSLVPSA